MIFRRSGVDIDVSNGYPVPPEVVLSMFVDDAFLHARAAALESRDLAIGTCTVDRAGATIEYVRSVPITVPGFATRFLSPRTTIEQIEEFGPEGERGGRGGSWRITARGAPIEMQGSMELVATDAGTLHHITGNLQVGIPLVGRKLKPFLLKDTLATIAAEHQFGLEWLGGGE